LPEAREERERRGDRAVRRERDPSRSHSPWSVPRPGTRKPCWTSSQPSPNS
jgi:hypothetical protein